MLSNTSSVLCPGYTWQDDTTQQVITKELAKLPKIPLRHLEASFADFPGTSR